MVQPMLTTVISTKYTVAQAAILKAEKWRVRNFQSVSTTYCSCPGGFLAVCDPFEPLADFPRLGKTPMNRFLDLPPEQPSHLWRCFGRWLVQSHKYGVNVYAGTSINYGLWMTQGRSNKSIRGSLATRASAGPKRARCDSSIVDFIDLSSTATAVVCTDALGGTASYRPLAKPRLCSCFIRGPQTGRTTVNVLF